MALSCSSRLVGVKMWVDPGDTHTHKETHKHSVLDLHDWKETDEKCVFSLCYECLLFRRGQPYITLKVKIDRKVMESEFVSQQVKMDY